MKKNKIKLIIYLLFISALTTFAQTQEKAKALFKEAKFEEAKPLFEKFLKQNPRNGNHNYYYGACLFETGEANMAIPYLEKAVERRVTDAHRYLALAYSKIYRFEEAQKVWENYFEHLRKRKKSSNEYLPEYERVSIGKQLMHSIREITIIDSTVVDKANFLQAYKIGEETGKLAFATDFFKSTYPEEAVVFQTEMGNKLFFSNKENKNDKLKLYSSDLIGDQWSNTQPLTGIESNGNISYPYLMSDGSTFYYAAQGNNSLGGYDIFVTRYDSEDNKFLLPENIGMPFNSPYNDYMYVIDEYNNLGWFASDRHQPEDKVCIYIFVPEENGRYVSTDSLSADTLYRIAAIHSIQSTQTDKKTVREGKQRLASCIYAQPQKKMKHDFEFIIDDLTTYHTINDFTSPEARTLFNRLVNERKNFTQLSDKLEKKRDEYAVGNQTKKSQMKAEILDIEQRLEMLEEELASLEVEIRKAEKKQ